MTIVLPCEWCGRTRRTSSRPSKVHPDTAGQSFTPRPFIVVCSDTFKLVGADIDCEVENCNTVSEIDSDINKLNVYSLWLIRIIRALQRVQKQHLIITFLHKYMIIIGKTNKQAIICFQMLLFGRAIKSGLLFVWFSPKDVFLVRKNKTHGTVGKTPS